MPTIDEINAGFDAIEIDVHQLIEQFVPPFFMNQALEKLNSQQGREIIVDGVRKALIAAEKVRAKTLAAHGR